MSAEKPDAPAGAKLELSESQQAAIARLPRTTSSSRRRSGSRARRHLRNDAVERGARRGRPRRLLGGAGRSAIDWIEPFTEVCRFEPPQHEWFLGGKLNATVNCIDRHVHSDRRNKAALLWVGEDGEEHTYTYNRLYREVNRFANALQRLGVDKGDRVIIYMPLVPEGIITMLACARIGAIHSVVFAGMGTQALRVAHRRLGRQGDRLLRLHLPPRQEDPAQAHGRRGGARPRLRRARRRPPPRLAPRRRAGRLRERARARLLRHPAGARDPLPRRSRWTPRTRSSSSTPRAPPGSRRASSTRPAATWSASPTWRAPSTRSASATSTGRTSDIGWIVGHSFIVYGPLSIGATVFCREGVPDYPIARRHLGALRALRRQRDVHRADGGAHVDEPRRRGAGEVRPLAPAAHRLRRRAAQPRGAPLGAEAPRRPVERHGGRQLVADRDRRAGARHAADLRGAPGQGRQAAARRRRRRRRPRRATRCPTARAACSCSASRCPTCCAPSGATTRATSSTGSRSRAATRRATSPCATATATSPCSAAPTTC